MWLWRIFPCLTDEKNNDLLIKAKGVGMKTKQNQAIRTAISKKYKQGFVTPVSAERADKGLTEDTIRFISKKKREPKWLLDWRMKSFHFWRDNLLAKLSLIHI